MDGQKSASNSDTDCPPPLRARVLLPLTGFSGTAFAIEAAHSIHARGTVEASSADAIVDIIGAFWPRPTVNANARITADQIRARSAVLADTRLHRAFVHVVLTMVTGERWRTLARIRINAIHANAAVLA